MNGGLGGEWGLGTGGCDEVPRSLHFGRDDMVVGRRRDPGGMAEGGGAG